MEDFVSQPDFVNEISTIGRTNILLIFTCRSNVFDLQFQAIERDFGGRYREVSLNSIVSSDASRWVDYLISYGYWKEKAALSTQQRIDFIASRCKGEIRGILLALLDSPLFREKLDRYFTKLALLPEAVRELIVYSTFLNFLNFRPNDPYYISTLMNKEYVAMLPRISADSDVFEIIARQNDLVFKSSVFGEYFLREYVPDDILVKLLSVFAARIDEKRHGQPAYGDLLRRMLRFSVIRALVSRRDGAKFIVQYFDGNSGLSIAHTDPLYWVQYSIARMDQKQFDLCENYIGQAYGIARGRRSYDTYQVDTHHARFLLESRISGFKDDDYFEAFKRAHKYVLSVLTRREEDLIYPLQVSQLYLDFFLAFKGRLTEREVAEIVKAAEFILDKISTYPTVLLERKSVGASTVSKMKELKAAAAAYL